jgi:threonine dehydratase
MTEVLEMRAPTREGVLRAAEKVAALLPPTPLIPFEFGGKTLWAKAECLQPIGAFKIRGAWHRISDLGDEERARGVVGVSSGNHAQGVAWAARELGIRATNVMPSNAPAVKLDRTRALGAEVVLYDRATGDRDAIAAELVAKTGATLVHAYADPWVIEGQGSAGIEIAAQMEGQADGPPTRIVAPCGGGGLSAGLVLACPDAEIVPVEPVGWDVIGQSLEQGRPLHMAPDAPPTICDCLQAPVAREINLAVLRDRAATASTITDDEARAAMRFAFSHLRLVVEPGAAAGLAALLAGKIAADGRTVVMLTGGNVDAARFAEVLAQS